MEKMPEINAKFLKRIYGQATHDRRRLPEGQARKVGNIKNLWQRSHEIINLHVLGMKNVDIAEKLGITDVSVSQIINSSLAQEKIKLMRGKREEDAFVAVEALEELVEDAIGVYNKILNPEDGDPVASLNLKKRTADTVLEINGLGPKRQLNIQSTHLIDSSESLKQVMAQGFAAIEASKMKLVSETEEIEYTEAELPDVKEA